MARAILASLLSIACAGCEKPPLSVAVPTVLDGVNPSPVSTLPCSGQDPVGQSLAWAVGARVRLVLSTDTVWSKSPLKNPQVATSEPSVWAIDAAPDSDGVAWLRAVGSGEATIRATADGADPVELVLDASAPSAMVLQWQDAHAQPDFPVVRPPLTKAVIGVGSWVPYAPFLRDATGLPLCVPFDQATLDAQVVQLSSDATVDNVLLLGGVSVTTNGTLDVTFANFRGQVPVAVVDDGAITSLEAKLIGAYSTAAYVLLDPRAGHDEVWGASVLVENLTPSLLELDDPASGGAVTRAMLPSGIAQIGFVSGASPGASGQVRASIPGSTVPPVTVTLTVPAS